MAQSKRAVEIRDVWRDNVDQEFAIIRDIIDDYPYVALDTEFPGAVCRAIGEFGSPVDKSYASLKANVDILRLIQLGLTFSDENGNLPPGNCVWQFNFCDFHPWFHPHMADSIELLKQSGIDFDRNMTHGISAFRFVELLMSSGVVLNSSVHWITFHSSYDFAYLICILTGRLLPNTLKEFLTLIRIFFPVLFDIKHLMKFCDNLYGGLEKLSKRLGIERYGNSHLAGSDSHVTLNTFFKLADAYFHGVPYQYAGIISGLESH